MSIRGPVIFVGNQGQNPLPLRFVFTWQAEVVDTNSNEALLDWISAPPATYGPTNGKYYQLNPIGTPPGWFIQGGPTTVRLKIQVSPEGNTQYYPPYYYNVAAYVLAIPLDTGPVNTGLADHC